MVLSRLHSFLTRSSDLDERRRTQFFLVLFWLILSLGFAIYYGSLGLLRAFGAEYVVQDDAREYVFWMQKFIDPTILPNDLIAQYFQSITPPGYAAIYHLMAIAGIDPLLLSKLLPIVLGFVTTIFGFGVCLRIFPVPFASFISTLLLNQSLWFRDDLSSATPRAFVYPLFLAFLYYLLRHNRCAIVVTLILQALIYPPLIFISIALLFLQLWRWEAGKLRLHQNRVPFIALAIVLSGFALVPYAISSGEFAPVITRSQAWTMPELHPGGRHPFFDPNPWKFWLIGEHSGIIPPLSPPLIWVGVFLPWVMRHPLRFRLVEKVTPAIAVLSQLTWVSLGLFFAAHALLLKLFFPTRYMTHSLRIVLAVAVGIVLTIVLDAIFRVCEELMQRQQSAAVVWRMGLTISIGIVLVFYPQIAGNFPRTNYRVATDGAIYQFLQKQPKESLVASLSDAANNIPTFARRSILFSKEYALPFHLGYYRQIQQRILDVIQAQNSPDLGVAKATIQKYGIDFWLLERSTFTPEFLANATWLASFQPAYTEALTQLHRGTVSALAKLTKRCAVVETEALILLEAKCILGKSDRGQSHKIFAQNRI